MSVDLGSAYAELKLKKDGFSAGLISATNELTAFKSQSELVSKGLVGVGSAATATGKTLTASLTVPVAGLTAAAVKTTATFDASMSRVQALSGATGDEFDILRNKAIEMGSKTAFSASESADALSYMALAGWDTQQMVSGLPGVLDLAASSQMDLAQASDMVTDFLTAFGLEAKDATNMANEMAYAQSHSNTTTQQLGEAFGNCAAQMHTAGQTMETTTALLEAMANQGLKGSEAGTALSAVMRDITQKMENGAIAIGDTSVAVMDQDGNFRNLIDIMADVEKATEGMGSAEKSAALMQTFTARSIKGVSMALTEGSESLYSYESALNSVDGVAGDMAEGMLNNLNGQLTILKSNVETLLIQIGDILMPKIKGLVENVQKLVQWFTSLSTKQKEQILRWATFAASIGPVLLILGKIMTSIGGLIGKVTAATKWLGIFAETFGIAGGAGGALVTILSSIASFVGPILAVVTAVALLVKGFKTLYDRGGEFASSVDNLVSKLKDGLGSTIEWLVGIFGPVAETLKQGWENIKNSIDVEAIDSALSGVIDTIGRVMDALQPVVEVIRSVLSPVLQAMATYMQLIISVTSSLVSALLASLAPAINVITDIVNIVMDQIQIITGLIEGLITGDFTNFKEAISHLGEDLLSLITDTIDTIVTFITTFIDNLGVSLAGSWDQFWYNVGYWLGQLIVKTAQFFIDLKEKISAKITETWEGIKQFVKDFPENFKKWLEEFPKKMKSLPGELKKAGEEAMNALWDGLKAVWESISAWFEGVVEKVRNFVQGIKDGMASASSASSSASSGSHADGLAYVPYNGYRATLHEGERVLTRNEAAAYNKGGSGTSVVNNFYSPKALDPYEANKLFRQTMKEMEEGFA